MLSIGARKYARHLIVISHRYYHYDNDNRFRRNSRNSNLGKFNLSWNDIFGIAGGSTIAVTEIWKTFGNN